MKRILLFAVLLFFMAAGTAFSQDRSWHFGHGIHYVDYYAPMRGESKFQSTNWSGNFVPKWLSVGYGFTEAIQFHTTFSFTKIDKFPGNITDDNFINWDIDFQYHLTDGFIMPERFPLDPYIQLGGGINSLDYWTRPSWNIGAGVNLWIHDFWGIGWQTAYTGVSQEKDFLHHVLALKFRVASVKDTDGDGIPDKEDSCPLVPGPENTNGCPDRDGDGIADASDNCPDVAGLMEFVGCPDRDGDGIMDKEDACPDVPGLKATKGCPDRDGDGIIDSKDNCPDVPGIATAQGCPDRDGDGIIDSKDLCPDTPGIATMQGCPDRDGDGIADKDDKCPDVAGIKANNGCPQVDEQVKKEVDKQLRFSAKNINFETSSDVILKESYKDLDNIVGIMNKYPTSKFNIEGHTDNSGNDAMNQDLSERRAQSVKKYFIDKGIDQSRLSAKGYGETKPIADNKTAEGRAANRRVEISIVN